MKEHFRCAVVLCFFQIVSSLLSPSWCCPVYLRVFNKKKFLKKRKRERSSTGRTTFVAPARKSVQKAREAHPCASININFAYQINLAQVNRISCDFYVKSRSLLFRFACPYEPDLPTRNGFESTDSSAYPLADLRCICYGESCSRSSNVTSRVAIYSRIGKRMILSAAKSLRIDACDCIRFERTRIINFKLSRFSLILF